MANAFESTPPLFLFIVLATKQCYLIPDLHHVLVLHESVSLGSDRFLSTLLDQIVNVPICDVIVTVHFEHGELFGDVKCLEGSAREPVLVQLNVCDLVTDRLD